MSRGHFEKGYWEFLREIVANGGAPCSDKPDFFFPEDIPDIFERQEATRLALQICKSCPLTNACLSYAIKNDERHGIWGGTLPTER